MSDATPTRLAAGRPNGGFIVMGVLAAVGVVLWLSSADAPAPARPVVDAGAPAQLFDLETDPHFNMGVALRPIDRDIFAAMKDPALTRERTLDLFPDRPYDVRLIGSVSEHYFGVVTIDLNRDGKPDERWDLRTPGQVVRVVTQDPNAPDNGPVKYTLAHGRWQVH